MMNSKISFQSDFIPDTKDIIDLYRSSGINRPIEDQERIAKMYAHSNLIISAWDGHLLVGISRSLTDHCFCCYLSDLAVRKEYQKEGIGRQLIHLTQEAIGAQSTLLLLAAAGAIGYYPKVGFDAIDNGFIIKRKI